MSTPEAHARHHIDLRLQQAGWLVQDLKQFNPSAGRGVAVREFLTDALDRLPRSRELFHFFQPQQLAGCFVDASGMDHVEDSFELSHADFLVEPGDILIALTRPITNDRLKICRYPEGRPRALLNQRVAALRPLNPALSSYLFYVMSSPCFRECMAAASTQTLQPSVAPHALRSVLVPIPPIEEAVFICNGLDQALSGAAAVESEVDRALAGCNAQRQNILRAAFSGQLVPQDPHDEPASVLLARIAQGRTAAAPKAKRRGARGAQEPG